MEPNPPHQSSNTRRCSSSETDENYRGFVSPTKRRCTGSSRTTQWRRRKREAERNIVYNAISSDSEDAQDSSPACLHMELSPTSVEYCHTAQKSNSCTGNSVTCVAYIDKPPYDVDETALERSSPLKNSSNAQLHTESVSPLLPPEVLHEPEEINPSFENGGITVTPTSFEEAADRKRECVQLQEGHVEEGRQLSTSNLGSLNSSSGNGSDSSFSSESICNEEISDSSKSSCSEYCPSSNNMTSAADSDSSENFSSDLDCYQAHYLDEGPQGEDPEPQPPDHDDRGDPNEAVDNDAVEPDDNDPEDPDDPGFNDSDSSNSGNSDNEDVQQVADLHHQMLQRNVQLAQNLTEGEIICLELASAIRHNKTYESIIDQFKNMNLLFGLRRFPESKTKLWSSILLNKAGIQMHVYCGRKACGRYIGRRSRLPNMVGCRCGYRIPLQKAKFFLTLDFKTQLMYFLGTPGIWDKLQYPQRRQKTNPEAVEDILDGAVYMRLRQEGGPLHNPNNISGILNLDTCSPTKKGSLKLVPVFIRVNELPPDMRQKFSFPVAIFVDHVEPNHQTLLKPIVQQLRILEARGIDWRPDGGNEINSKFILMGFNVDSPVRYQILNMSKWDCAAFGCTYCTHPGVRVAGSQRFPLVHLEGIPPFHDRHHHQMVASMIQAQQGDMDNVQGHKGASVLMLLRHLDLRDGQGVDDLHQDYLGCAAHLTNLLLTTPAARTERHMREPALARAINVRLTAIKTPSSVARKPRSIDKRGSYSGSEWRNWLLFYAVPCLLGLIRPQFLDILALLSHGCSLLSQDSIPPGDIAVAERLLIRCATSFERTFGVQNLRYNFHVTTKHKVRCVRNLGSPWAYSTFSFESLNRKMVAKVTSPKGAAIQIVTRLMLQMTVHAAQYDERLSEDVRLRVEEILNPYQLKTVHRIGPHMYLVGRGVGRAINAREAALLEREGVQVNNITVFKSFLKGSTRYRSLGVQNRDIKSDDSFVYSSQDTFCTLRCIFSYVNDAGEEMYGAFVDEHDVLQVVPIARHISLLRPAHADLHHFIHLQQVLCPAIRIHNGNMMYAVRIPINFAVD